MFGFHKNFDTKDPDKRDTQSHPIIRKTQEFRDKLNLPTITEHLHHTYQKIGLSEELLLEFNPNLKWKYLIYSLNKEIYNKTSLNFLNSTVTVRELIHLLKKSLNPELLAQEAALIEQALANEANRSATDRYREKFWRIMTNRNKAKEIYAFIEKHRDKAPVEGKPESAELTNDTGAFVFMYGFTPEQQKQINGANQTNLINQTVDALFESWQVERRESGIKGPTWNPELLVPLPNNRAPNATWLVGSQYVKSEWNDDKTSPLYQTESQPKWKKLRITSRTISKAFTQAFNHRDREKKRSSDSHPFATDLLVSYKVVPTVDGVPQIPKLDDVSNDKQLLTGHGAWGALQLFLNDQGALVGMAFKYNHQFIDGAQAKTESKQLLKKVISDLQTQPENEFVPALAEDQLSELQKQAPPEIKTRHQTKIYEATFPRAGLSELSQKLWQYQLYLKENSDNLPTTLTDTQKEILGTLRIADFGMSTLVHLVSVMALGRKSGHYLEMKRNTSDIGLTFLINPFSKTPTPDAYQFLRALSLFKMARGNIQSGEPGEIESFAAYSKLMKGTTILIGKGTDPLKTMILANSIYTSSMITNKVDEAEPDDPVDLGFVTALQENYEATVGNSYRDENIHLSLRCRSKNAKKYRQFETNIRKNQAILEEYLKDLLGMLGQLLPDAVTPLAA